MQKSLLFPVEYLWLRIAVTLVMRVVASHPSCLKQEGCRASGFTCYLMGGEPKGTRKELKVDK